MPVDIWMSIVRQGVMGNLTKSDFSAMFGEDEGEEILL